MQSRDVAKLILERWPGQNKVLDRRRRGERAAVSGSTVRAETRPKQGCSWRAGQGGLLTQALCSPRACLEACATHAAKAAWCVFAASRSTGHRHTATFIYV